ncbi:MAG: hypothetical protein WD335_00295 [Candidatus Paceibacterota bacterium]
MGFLDITVGWFFAETAQIFFNAVAWIVAQIGYLLDYTVEKMVLEMAELVNGITAIDALWSTFRDLGNIVFIGVLLYIAIRTILNVGNSFNTKRILVRLVIVALFVNFSLFASKVVIDTSNVVALQFYNSIQVEECGESACNISHFFADVTNISSVQSPEALEALENEGSEEGANFKILIARVMGIVFLAVVGFVMAAMAFLLLIRFGFLILLMIASPLAFIAFVLPGTSDMGQKWLHNLFNQSFFAPILFAMVYVVAVLGAELANGLGGNGDLMAAILDPDGDNYGVILTFALMTFLMAYTLVVAKQMGGWVTQKSMQVGVKARNWTGAKVVGATAAGVRATAGRGGQKASESRGLKDAASDENRNAVTRFGARAALKLSDKAANSSFDMRNTRAGKAAGVDDGKQRSSGFRQVVEEKAEKRKEEKGMIERLSPEEKAKVERAKIKQEQADKSLEKAEKEIKKLEKEAKTRYEDAKENAQAQYDRVKNTVEEAQQQTNNELTDVTNNLKQVSSAIKKRAELGDKLAAARSSGDRRLEERIAARLNALTDDIDGVSNLEDLDTKQNDLQDRKSDLESRKETLQRRRNTVQNAYNDRKSQARNVYTDERDELKTKREVAKESTKKFKKKMDNVINVGNKRGEGFVETMLEQQSTLDKIAGFAGYKFDTTQSRANRDFALENIGDIKSKDEDSAGRTAKDRASSKLRNIYNT